jgi:hypothetical protein
MAVATTPIEEEVKEVVLVGALVVEDDGTVVVVSVVVEATTTMKAAQVVRLEMMVALGMVWISKVAGLMVCSGLVVIPMMVAVVDSTVDMGLIEEVTGVISMVKVTLIISVLAMVIVAVMVMAEAYMCLVRAQM